MRLCLPLTIHTIVCIGFVCVCVCIYVCVRVGDEIRMRKSTSSSQDEAFRDCQGNKFSTLELRATIGQC